MSRPAAAGNAMRVWQIWAVLCGVAFVQPEIRHPSHLPVSLCCCHILLRHKTHTVDQQATTTTEAVTGHATISRHPRVADPCCTPSSCFWSNLRSVTHHTFSLLELYSGAGKLSVCAAAPVCAHDVKR
ncbi:unnamed protein product [Laminaria digitata]